jgi:hypothetical protein
VTLKYLSKADANTLYIDGTPSSRTKQALASGVSIALTQNWTNVRITNTVDDDHTGPAVEVASPEYVRQYNTRGITGTWAMPWWDPKKTMVDNGGLKVSVAAKDRSGVAWVKIYHNWELMDSLTAPPYETTLPKSRFLADSIHAIHAVACDILGNEEESFSVPFKVLVTGESTGIEVVQGVKSFGNAPVNASVMVARQGVSSGAVKQALSAKGAKAAVVSGADSWVARGRVQPKNGVSAEVSGTRFEYGGVEYVFGLDASKGKAVLFRGNAHGAAPIGDAVTKVKSGGWYDLRVEIADGRMIGYVNGDQKLVVTGL